MITNTQIGQRVKIVSSLLDNGQLFGRTGIIIEDGFSDEYFKVRLDGYYDVNPVWLNSVEVEFIAISSEEETKFKEQIRREEEQRLDQQRRKQHAEKYL